MAPAIGGWCCRHAVREHGTPRINVGVDQPAQGRGVLNGRLLPKINSTFFAHVGQRSIALIPPEMAESHRDHVDGFAGEGVADVLLRNFLKFSSVANAPC